MAPKTKAKEIIKILEGNEAAAYGEMLSAPIQLLLKPPFWNTSFNLKRTAY